MKWSLLSLILVIVQLTPVRAQQFLAETNNKIHYTELTARKQINLLYRQLKAGYAFDKLARQYSQDYGSFSTGGSLGWQKPSQFVATFTQVVSQLTKSQFSKPFKTEFGYHIVQLIDTREGEVLAKHIVLKVSD